MKKCIALIACILGIAFSALAQEKSTFVQGPMSVNAWTGQLEVGGVTIQKELWDRYFSEEDLASFKTGKVLNDVGGIISCVGAFPLGYGLGYMIGWRIAGGPTTGEMSKSYKTAQTCLWIGLGVTAVGLAIGIPGSIKMNRAIKNYNLSLSYQPELRFGNTQNGVGLAFVF